MFKRLDHRVGRSSQATSAAVDKSRESLKHKNSDSPIVMAGKAKLLVRNTNLLPVYASISG